MGWIETTGTTTNSSNNTVAEQKMLGMNLHKRSDPSSCINVFMYECRTHKARSRNEGDNSPFGCRHEGVWEKAREIGLDDAREDDLMAQQSTPRDNNQLATFLHQTGVSSPPAKIFVTRNKGKTSDRPAGGATERRPFPHD
ncbi:unnamed protein product, partial [Ectocarpus sp. 12 AP-2014]